MQNDKIMNSKRKALIGMCIFFSLLSLSGTADAQNNPPIAGAGAGVDQYILTNQNTYLSGQASDPNRDDYLLGFRWLWQATEVPEGADWSLVNEDTGGPDFRTNMPEDYTFSLIVVDSHGAASASDYVTIHAVDNFPVLTGNRPPRHMQDQINTFTPVVPIS